MVNVGDIVLFSHPPVPAIVTAVLNSFVVNLTVFIDGFDADGHTQRQTKVERGPKNGMVSTYGCWSWRSGGMTPQAPLPRPVPPPPPPPRGVEIITKKVPPIEAHYDGLIQDLVNALDRVCRAQLDGYANSSAADEARVALETAAMLGWPVVKR